MKKILVAFAMALVASTAQAIIEGGPHDLSSTGPGVKGTKGSCQYCHAPHVWNSSNISVVGTPLWNRNWNNTGLTAYGSTVVNNYSTPGPMSQTCLSCHIGNVDVGAVNNGPSETLQLLDTAAEHSVGSDMRNDHPVGLAIPAITDYFASQTTYPTFGASKLVECASCHEPHTGGAGAKFLRTSGVIDCGACHNK
jgi:hypothetical protein